MVGGVEDLQPCVLLEAYSAGKTKYGNAHEQQRARDLQSSSVEEIEGSTQVMVSAEVLIGVRRSTRLSSADARVVEVIQWLH